MLLFYTSWEVYTKFGTVSSAMGNFLKALKTTQAPIADFTPQLWNALVEKATVNADGSMVFTFRNGVEIRQKP